MIGFCQNEIAKEFINCFTPNQLEGFKVTFNLLKSYFPNIDSWTLKTKGRINFGSKNSGRNKPIFCVIKSREEKSITFRVSCAANGLYNATERMYGNSWNKHGVRVLTQHHYNLDKVFNDPSSLREFLENLSKVPFIIERANGTKSTPDDHPTGATPISGDDTNENETPDNYNADPRVWCQIKRRRGQANFRKLLMSHYNKTCAISGCKAVYALEAAHITPISKNGDYSCENGLLLRADIHTLFDLNLIGVDQEGLVHVSPKLDDELYKDLVENNKQVKGPDCKIFKSNLAKRFEDYEAVRDK